MSTDERARAKRDFLVELGTEELPPKALDDPKPASSIKMTRTLGAPAGGRSWRMGGYFVSGSLAS